MKSSDSCSDRDSDSDNSSGSGGIKLSAGLSADTLAALFKFVKASNGNESDADKDGSNNAVCDKEAMSKEISDQLDHRMPNPIMTPVNLEATEPCHAVDYLRENGVVRLDNILSHELCDACAAAINVSLQVARDAGIDYFSDTKEMGFGNVDANNKRWDMYLNNQGPFQASMQYMFGESSTVLSTLFSNLFNGVDPQMYEYAALISDSGAVSQRIHSDTTFQTECPLYTVFIALQDITSDMGPTIFLPGSNTEVGHTEFRFRRNQFIDNSISKHSLLKKGDVTVMDSRSFHCGSANNSLYRRALFYFTLLNPNITNMGEGSMFENMKPLNLSTFSSSYGSTDGVLK